MPHAPYPVLFETRRPAQYDRIQLLLRLLILLVLGYVGTTPGWLFSLFYLVLPVLAAIQVSRRGAGEYLSLTQPRVVRVLHWFLAFNAYLSLVIDRFPTDDAHTLVRYDVGSTGTTTVGGALLRLITSLPHVLALLLLGIMTSFAWLVAAIAILATRRCPDVLYGFLRGVIRWQARLFAYHASLVDRYPPFALDMESEAEPFVPSVRPPPAPLPS